MFYTNFIKRFILRKDFFRRAKGRINETIRILKRNEVDDIHYLFTSLGYEPSTVFDCGANVGFVTHQFNRKFPNAKIFSFEPNPTIFKKLNLHYANNSKVVAINAGVGSETGSMTFYINANSGTSSFLPPTDYHMNNIASRNVSPIEVQIMRIEDFMNEHSISHIDVLKLDIEGFEIEALKGINNLSDKVSIIYAEVNFIPTYEGQPLIDEVISYIRSKGFHVFNLYGIHDTTYRQGLIANMVFISNSIKVALSEKLGERSFGY